MDLTLLSSSIKVFEFEFSLLLPLSVCSIYATRRVLIAGNVIFIAEKLKECRFSKPFFFSQS